MGRDRQVDEKVYNALESIKVLLGLFVWERVIYLIVGFASVTFLFAITIKFLLMEEALNRPLAVALLGSSGLLTGAAFRIVYFFNKSFDVVQEALRTYLGGK